jgi:16S rRNA (uracil1498-N3)-methyltransferase
MKQEHRFFVEGVSFDQRDVVFSDPALAHQLLRVLRYQKGETIILLDNSGFEYEVRIVSLEKEKLAFYILSKRKSLTEPSLHINLYQAVLKKKEKFEFVLQKGTEIGISRFIPLRTEYSEFLGKLNMTRSYLILKEAAEQSHRGRIPELSSERVFSDVLGKIQGIKILLDPMGAPLQSVVSDIIRQKECHIFIGPEGGFSPHEIAFAKQQGVHVLSLGKRILRSETAGLVIASILFYEASVLYKE